MFASSSESVRADDNWFGKGSGRENKPVSGLDSQKRMRRVHFASNSKIGIQGAESKAVSPGT